MIPSNLYLPKKAKRYKYRKYNLYNTNTSKNTEDGITALFTRRHSGGDCLSFSGEGGGVVRLEERAHSAHWTLHSAHWSMQTEQCTLHTELCTLNNAHCTMHTAQSQCLNAPNMKKPFPSIVNFPNSGCVGNSGIDGTCYTASQCSSRVGPDHPST